MKSFIDPRISTISANAQTCHAGLDHVPIAGGFACEDVKKTIRC